MEFDDRMLPSFERHSGLGSLWWAKLAAVCLSMRAVHAKYKDCHALNTARIARLSVEYKQNPVTIRCKAAHYDGGPFVITDISAFLSKLPVVSMDQKMLESWCGANDVSYEDAWSANPLKLLLMGMVTLGSEVGATGVSMDVAVPVEHGRAEFCLASYDFCSGGRLKGTRGVWRIGTKALSPYITEVELVPRAGVMRLPLEGWVVGGGWYKNKIVVETDAKEVWLRVGVLGHEYRRHNDNGIAPFWVTHPDGSTQLFSAGCSPLTLS